MKLLDVIDGKLTKLESLSTDATYEQIKKNKDKLYLFGLANSYVKPMVTTTITNAVCEKDVDKEAAYEL